uniref:Uncharacterized protein n=1 Tax=Arundo donax TaxID=35708 RepID=A0A0A9FN58_ARUDO
MGTCAGSMRFSSRMEWS